MIIKVHKRGNEVIVAACDDELLDKTFRGDGLKLHVSKRFYGEESCGEEELIAALRRCTSANLVGKMVIEAAVKAGFILEACVLYIGDVPHAQLYKMPPSACRPQA
jgi:hypothetical protein